MKVILVNKFHYAKGGSETYYFGLAEGLRKLGHEVHYFAMQGPENYPCEDADLFVSAKDYNGPSSVTQKISAATSLIYSKEAKAKFQELCERVRPDVVHMGLVHRQITLSILDAPYLREHRAPVLFTSHDYILACPNYVMIDGRGEVCDACLNGRFSNCLKRKCVKGSTAKSGMAFLEAEFLKAHKAYQRIDRIIAPSMFMRDKLVESGFPEDQVIFLQNFAKSELLESARDDVDGRNFENPYMLFFGRLSKEKGIDVLIEAFMQVLPGMPADMQLVIAGDGPERDAIEQKLLLFPKAAAKRVQLVGFQEGSDMRRYIQGAALAVCPSVWRENMPYSILEAFALGVPVVGSRIGGIPELVREGVTGYLAEPGDSESLSDAILRCVTALRDDETASALRRNCKSYVLDHCDSDAYMKTLIALYQELIDAKKGIR